MTAVCQICNQLIEGNRPLLTVLAGVSEQEAQAMSEIAEFDLLAGRMNLHLSTCHPVHAGELSAVMYLAGKVYAMTWAVSVMPNFERLREAWRAGIFNMLQTTGQPDQAAGAAGSESESGDESNMKNSSRNTSN